MRCTFCITDDDLDQIKEHEAFALLTLLRDYGFQSLVIGGGEPFFWPGNLILLTQRAKELGFFVQIGTNAIALPPGYASIASIDRFVIPLESMDPSIHNEMRCYHNQHHQLILETLSQLKAANKSTTLSTVITKKNAHELIKIANFINENHHMHVHAWHLYQLLPEGREGKKCAYLKISDGDYLTLTKKIQKMNLKIQVFRRINMYHSSTVRFFWYQNGELRTDFLPSKKTKISAH